jgi:hypothetical protein
MSWQNFHPWNSGKNMTIKELVLWEDAMWSRIRWVPREPKSPDRLGPASKFYYCWWWNIVQRMIAKESR